MPYKNIKKSSKPNATKKRVITLNRYNRAKLFQQNRVANYVNNVPISSQFNNALTPTRYCKHKYSTPFQLGNSGSTSFVVVRANSLYDPDYQTGGRFPSNYTLMAQMYGNYIVL